MGLVVGLVGCIIIGLIPYLYTIHFYLVNVVKQALIQRLREIKAMGYVPNARYGNVGGVGNTLEDLLGLKENNLPIPNASEWELKCQRINTTSLTTLFHMEPSPQALRLAPSLLLPKYGWLHQEAGRRHPLAEMSFRQTICGNSFSDRGFRVLIDKATARVLISFDSSHVSPRHSDWLESVASRAGNLGELDPQPYWGFKDLEHKAGGKLYNCFYVQARVTRDEGGESYYYERVLMLREFDFDRFLIALDNGVVLVDFDARTGHNHGTKFRLRQNRLPELYHYVEVIE